MEQQKEARARWRRLLSEQKASGKSIAGFCRDRGLPIWQFYEWKKRLLPAETSAFVAVELVDSETAPAPVRCITAERAPIEIRLRSGRSLLVGADFETNHLRRLLAVLEQE